MSLKKPYWPPSIEVVSLDVDISVCMTSPETPPDPGTRPDMNNGSQGASSFESTNEDDSGIKENPFR